MDPNSFKQYCPPGSLVWSPPNLIRREAEAGGQLWPRPHPPAMWPGLSGSLSPESTVWTPGCVAGGCAGRTALKMLRHHLLKVNMSPWSPSLCPKEMPAHVYEETHTRMFPVADVKKLKSANQLNVHQQENGQRLVSSHHTWWQEMNYRHPGQHGNNIRETEKHSWKTACGKAE